MRPAASLLLAAGLVLPACAKDPERQARRGARAEGRYELGEPGEGWLVEKPGGADRAWFHPERAAAIYADSNCGDRYEDGALSDLLTHLTFGIAQGAPLREEALRLDDREALLRTWDGALDGVTVRVGAVVTKKHRCVYDLLYIAPPTAFDQGWGDFVSVVEGFSVQRH